MQDMTQSGICFVCIVLLPRTPTIGGQPIAVVAVFGAIGHDSLELEWNGIETFTNNKFISLIEKQSST